VNVRTVTTYVTQRTVIQILDVFVGFVHIVVDRFST